MKNTKILILIVMWSVQISCCRIYVFLYLFVKQGNRIKSVLKNLAVCKIFCNFAS